MFQLIDGNEVDVTVFGIDGEGNVAPIDATNPVSATSSDENIATVVAGPDNSTVTVKSTGPTLPIGAFSVSIAGTSAAGVPVSVVWEGETIAGDATGLTAVAGDQRPRTP